MLALFKHSNTVSRLEVVSQCLLEYYKSEIIENLLTLAFFTETPAQQQTLEMPVLARKKCTDVYEGVIPVTQDHLCVGGERNKDACSGFGGAPLFYLDSSDQPRYFQVLVTL